jgi:4-hydroxy-tetrahydrodipicolinate synthase
LPAYTAIITPFDDRCRVDEAAMVRLLAWHEANGMDGVVVAGTNGEGPSLSGAEKRDLYQLACSQQGRLRIIAGLGTCALSEATWLARRAAEAGAEMLLVQAPFYFKSATERGIEAFFDAVLSETEVPTLLYNHPMTGFTLPPEMLARLAEKHVSFAGVKDSSGDFALFERYREALPNKIVLVGDERLLLRSLRAGGDGTISGLANSVPHLIARQLRERSEALQMLIDEAVDQLKRFPQPAVHKCVLNLIGLPGGALRPPLEPLAETQVDEVRTFLARFAVPPSA